MTDEQPDQPRPDLPPTLPLPTEPMKAFGARARAEMPDAAQVPVAAPPSEPPAPPTMPVVYLPTPPADPTQPIPPAPAVGSASVPTAPTAPISSAPAVGSAQVATPPLAPISSAPAVGSAQVSTPPVAPSPWTPPVAAAPPAPAAPVAPPVPPVAPPPAARATQPTQPAPPRLQLPHTPAPATRPPATPPGRPAAGPGPVLVQLGEVSVSSTTIHTPAGEIPLRGSQWAVSDQWHSQQRIPAWAVVCAVVGFFLVCFLSLLFLLAKETRYNGTVQVIITNGQRQYVVRIPVTDQRVVAHIHAQVNYARSLAAL
ncbi:hypothetical protein [Catellatospora sichuanensis]|uniref:hypothetical protein n=1 Tax=Catellatospora sichuanensis TaxID=1969805 RepID=UPI001FE2DE42|nr:hypothetical protein [Catellatospora sichuanensis]